MRCKRQSFHHCLVYHQNALDYIIVHIFPRPAQYLFSEIYYAMRREATMSPG